jgi:hypothetical protein
MIRCFHGRHTIRGGFGTFAGRDWVIESVVWLKLRSLREGADIAAQRRWGSRAAIEPRLLPPQTARIRSG